MDKRLKSIIDNALLEDMPSGDVTTDALFTSQKSEAYLISKAQGIVSGLDIFEAILKQVDASTEITLMCENGAHVQKGTKLATIKGKTASILKGERTALNILQRMSGIATMTRQFKDAVKDTDCKIYDTRKTLPNLRMLDKRAVKDGGGVNHRFSLSDMVMIKDNHISAAGSIKKAVKAARDYVGKAMEIEIEVESVDQFKEALATDADRVMLDNMDLKTMRACVELNNKKKFLEASGNMTLERVTSVASTGVDAISVGALTHSVCAFDISLKFEEDNNE